MNKKMQFTTVGAVITIVSIGLICFGLGDYDGLNYDDTRMMFKLGIFTLVVGIVVSTIGVTMKKQ